MRVFIRSYHLFTGSLLLSSARVSLLPRYCTTVAIPSRDNLQVQYLKSVIEKKETNWTQVKSNILSKDGTITQKNIDAVIIKYITTQKEYDYVYSFVDYLRNSGTELNLGATNSLLNLYFELSKENQLSEEAKKFILDSYKSLNDKYEVLDYYTCERLLHALCAIGEWKKCFKILDDIHLSSTPTHSAYSTLIATLFKNNRKAEAIKLIKRSLNDSRSLQDNAYDEWLKYILRKDKDKKIILKHLDEFCLHLAPNYIKVSEATARRIQETYESLGWSVKYTNVQRDSGKCISCNGLLEDIQLSEEEFSLLHQNVKDKLIVGSDLFLKTCPAELERFSKLVERTGPYDVVLDGLNIAYIMGKGLPLERIKIISFVVDYFAKQNKKILLLGRKHMYKWHAPALKELSRKTFSFFTENVSQDDPYFISAAILSGPNTYIVSRDLLRGHRFLMKDEKLRFLFQKWQWKHQWMVFPNKTRPMLQPPIKFNPCAQKNDCGWHIPYERILETDKSFVNNGDPDCSSWLCIRERS